VLFALPAVLSAIRQGHRIILCEGEKCAAHLNTFFREHSGSGDVATTCAGGAHGWRPEYAESLRGADVIIWPDADPAGMALLEAAVPSLVNVAASVRVITPDIVRRHFG
jgi:putative DNA primase/helicase